MDSGQASRDGSHLQAATEVNFRLLAAFALGWALFYSVQCIVSSPFVYGLGYKARLFLQQSGQDSSVLPVHSATAINGFFPIRMNSQTSTFYRAHDHTSLVFTLNLCFIFASLSMFMSLIFFNPGVAWDTGCTFLIAWAGMASRSARLIGILILCLELRRNRVRKWEMWGLWAALSIAVALMFTMNALSLGKLEPIALSSALGCARKFSLPAALASSLLQLVVEVYVAIRLMSIHPPSRRGFRSVLDSLSTVHLCRALSLITMELLTIVPDAIKTNVLVVTLPFVAGAVLVLAAFNCPSRQIKTALPSPIITEKAYDDDDGLAHLNISPDSLFVIGPPPSSHAPSQRVSLQTHATSMTGASVEDAVVYTAARSTFSQGSLINPRSAPGRVEATPEQPLRGRRYILSYQVAEELGRMAEEPEHKEVPGPAVPRRAKPNMTVVVHDANEEFDGTITAALRTDGSEVYGSDIIQSSNSRLHKGGPVTGSNESTISYQSTTEYGLPGSRSSYASTQYRGVPSEYYADDQRSSILSKFSRFSRGKSTTPARHSFLKMSAPIGPRLSVASTRTRSSDNMPTLSEGRPIVATRSISLRSKRSRQSTKDDTPPMPPLPLNFTSDASRLQVPTRGPGLRLSSHTLSSNLAPPPSSYSFTASIDDSLSDSSSTRYQGPQRPPSAFIPNP
ncbi:hypothetical protein QCA50_000485 [Cerrena zonata]|uniref:Uncharacterized protein n=1 Tax=Cerrena zonata TaxID=2478898 RepID=A0AAW0GZ44_9APHY